MVTSRMSSAMRMKKEKNAACGENGNEPVQCDEMHVLAVDDCLIERKVIEKLLKTNFFKGALLRYLMSVVSRHRLPLEKIKESLAKLSSCRLGN
jgi:hypothetical protein